MTTEIFPPPMIKMPCTAISTADRAPPKGWELCPCSGYIPLERNKQYVVHVKSLCHQRWLGAEIQKEEEAKVSQSLPDTALLPSQ